MLVERYSIQLRRPPCNPGFELLSAFGSVSVDLDPVIPYLNAVIKGGAYNAAMPSLTFHRGHRMMTVQPRQIGATACRDEEHAREVLDELVALINDTWARRDEIEPDHDEVAPLTVLDVYRFLPGLNCGECGELACMAFAAKIVSGERALEECRRAMDDAAHQEKTTRLVAELVARGYPCG